MSWSRRTVGGVAVAGAIFFVGPTGAWGLYFQPELGLPANNVEMVGASPGETPGEVWASGEVGDVPALVEGLRVGGASKPVPALLRRSDQSGWQIVPVVNAKGEQLGFTNSPGVGSYRAFTYRGGIALLGHNSAGEETIITRDPGGQFATAPVPPSGGPEAVMGTGEQLPESSPLAVALDEPGRTGAVVLPVSAKAAGPELAPGVLHYDGTHWTREPICQSYVSGASCATPETATSLQSVLALAASSPENTWLLAVVASSGNSSLALFKREPTGTGGFVWVQPSGWTFTSGLPAGAKVVPPPTGSGLTVSPDGVWVDAELQLEGGSAGSVSRLFSASSPNVVLGTWCYPSPQALCGPEAHSLGAKPNSSESYAWPGDPGTRIIVQGHGSLLVLRDAGDFEYVQGLGRGAGGAFASPGDGWLNGAGNIGQNGAEVVHVTATLASSQLESWPVPFRRPLLAVAPQPGTEPGDSNARVLAVGDQGQIARYIPGEGWTPEFLYGATGAVETPRLRGVAWPEPGRAYAVGDEGAMWVWRNDTGLWEPDAAKPVGFAGNLSAIAFSPASPTIGYAVGKQGVLLSYDKTWTQQQPPAGLEGANFTSVTFAGEEALATYRLVNAAGTGETGGLLIKETPQSAWQIDPSAQTLLKQLPNQTDTVLSKVAGLPDGGAVAAGPGVVIERDSASSSWRLSGEPLPEAQNIAALAAIREGPSVRALVSISPDLLDDPNQNSPEGDLWLRTDFPPASGFGQPSTLIGPDPLPVSGYLLRETPSGWQDIEHQAYPNTLDSPANLDEPAWPDAVLALEVGPNGREGWAVGGQTGGIVELSSITGAKLAAQTASAWRLGSGPAPPQSTGEAIPTPPGQATFAVGGDAQCAASCAEFASEGLGPDVWLSSSLRRAAQIPGLRGFLYTGSHIAPPTAGAPSKGAEELAEEFAREMTQYRSDLSAAGALPVYPAATSTDIEPRGGGLSTFDATILGGESGSAPAGTPSPPAGTAAYAFQSGGAGGPVRVIVLDYSAQKLAPSQLSWLTAQLDDAKAVGVPAIVMGSADLINPEADNYAQDAPAVVQVLLGHGASAYFFESPEANRSERIGSGANTIPAFGTGTLGYVLPPVPLEESLGSSGFLLASVNVAQRSPSSNRAPVSVSLVPNIAQLGLDAADGTLLRRSQVALFQALARIPPAGFELAGGSSSNAEIAPEPYVPIPEICKGGDCAQFIAPGYTFSSSRPDIGDFVEPDPSNANPRAVLQGPDGKPIPDPQSGLFCAFNAGTTTVSITTGGLTYSTPVTVQAGSVEQPCGTVPLKNPPPASAAVKVPPAPLSPNQTPSSSSPTPVSLAPPPAPLLSTPALPPSVPKPPPSLPPFFAVPPPAVPLVVAPLLPQPVLARPIPPSGTAPVTVFSPAVAPEEKREEEEATESVHNMAAYRPDNANLPPTMPLALIVIAAAAGAGVVRASRGSRTPRRPALARATTHSRRYGPPR
jgi:hypothetical protein